MKLDSFKFNLKEELIKEIVIYCSFYELWGTKVYFQFIFIERKQIHKHQPQGK